METTRGHYFVKSLFGFFALAFGAALFSLVSCEVGLGPAVDVNAPTLTVEYPPTNSTIRETFYIAGTVNDDVQVARVLVDLKNIDDGEGSTAFSVDTKEATLSSDKKSWWIDFNEYNESKTEWKIHNGWKIADGSYKAYVYAYDTSNRSSAVATVSFSIDNSAPVLIVSKPGTKGAYNPVGITAYGRRIDLKGDLAAIHAVDKMNLYFREYNKTTNTFGDEKALELNDFRAVSSDNPFIIAQFMPKSEIEEKDANGNFIYTEDTRKYLMNLRENYFAMYGKDNYDETKDTYASSSIDKIFYTTFSIEDGARPFDNPQSKVKNAPKGSLEQKGNISTRYYIKGSEAKTSLQQKLFSTSVQPKINSIDIANALSGTAATDERKEQAKIILEVLNDKNNYVDIEKDEKVNANSSFFILNPDNAPTYTAEYYQLKKPIAELTANDYAVYRSGPIGFILEKGKDLISIAPKKTKITIYKVTANPNDSDLSDNESLVVFDGKDSVQPSGDKVTESINVYDVIEKSARGLTWIKQGDIFRIVVEGQDLDGNELAVSKDKNGERYSGFGFKYVSSGMSPAVTIETPSGQFTNDTSLVLSGAINRYGSDAEVNDHATKAPIIVKDSIYDAGSKKDVLQGTYYLDIDTNDKWKLELTPVTSGADASAKKIAEGKHTFVVMGYTTVGSSIEQVKTITVDITKPTWKTEPTIRGVSVSGKNWITTNTPEVVALAEDNISKDENIFLSWKTESMTSAKSVTNGDFTVVLSKTGTEANTLTISAKDETGNTSEKTLTVYVDKTAPAVDTVTINSKPITIGDTSVANAKAEKVDFAFTASDETNGSGLKDAKIIKVGKTTLGPPIDAAFTSGTWNATIPKAQIKAGDVILQLTDNAGNKSESKVFAIALDGKAPELKITKPINDKDGYDTELDIGTDVISGYINDDGGAGLSESVSKIKWQTFKLNESGTYVWFGPGATATEYGSLTLSGMEANYRDFVIKNAKKVVEGTYKIVISGITDDVGNKAPNVERIIPIDKAPPAITTAFVRSGSTDVKNYPYITNVKNALSMHIVASDSNALTEIKINLNRDGTLCYTKTIKEGDTDLPVGSTKFDHIITDIQPTDGFKDDGDYVIIVRAKDIAGKQATEISRSITIDTTAPIITAPTEPASSTWQQVSKVSVKGTASDDNGTGVSSVEYTVSASTPTATTIWKKLTGATTWLGELELNEGSNNVWYRAKDNAGNETVTATAHTIKVDSVKPSLTITKPANSETKFTKNSFDVEFSTSDATSGLAKLLYTTNSAFTDAKEATTAEITAGKFTISNIPVSATYYFKALDNAGNESDVITKQVRYDATPPTVELKNTYTPQIDVGGVKKTNGTITITGIASDNEKLASVKITDNEGNNLKGINGNANASELRFTGTNANSFSFTLDTTKYTNTLILKAVAEDEFGNTNNATLTLNIDQDTDRPVVVVTNLAKLIGYTANTELYLTVSDDDGAVKKTEYKIGSSPWTEVSEGKIALGADGEKAISLRVTDASGTLFSSETGTTPIKIYAEKNGNSAADAFNITTSSFTVNLDTVPPEIGDVKYATITGGATSSASDLVDGTIVKKVETLRFMFTAKDNSGLASDSPKVKFADGAETSVTGISNSYTYDVTAPSTSGTVKFTISAEDVSGKTTSKVVNIVYDQDVPEVTITKVTQNSKEVANDGWVTNGVLNIAGTVSDALTKVAKVEAKVDATPVPLAVNNGSYSGNLSISTTESRASVTITATDGAGNTKDAIYNFSVDNAKPTITVNKVNGEMYALGNKILLNTATSGSISLELSGSDVDAGFDHYEYSLGGASYENLSVDSSNVAKIDVTTDTTIKVRGIDKVGLSSDEWQIPVEIDSEEPTVQFANNVENNMTINKTVVISGSASDTKGLKEVELEITAGTKADGTTAVGLLQKWTATAGYNWTYNLDTTQYKDDSDLTLSVVATDNAGNTSTVETRTLKIDQDTDRPQIVIQSFETLADKFLKSKTLSGSILDDDGVASLEVQVDGGAFTAVPVTLGNWTYQITGDDGEKTVVFKVVDKANETFTTGDSNILKAPRVYAKELGTDNGSAKSLKFTLDTINPTIKEAMVKVGTGSYETPATKNLFKGETITLKVTGTDASGIKEIKATLNGDEIFKESFADSETTKTVEKDVSFAGKKGNKPLTFIITDNAGKISETSYQITIDEEGPTTEITYPKSDTAIAGKIEILGVLSDDTVAGSGVVGTETKWMFATSNTAPTEASTGWQDMKSSTVANFSFDYNFPNYRYDETSKVLKVGTETLPNEWKVTDKDQYDLRLYILTKDKAGNYKVNPHIIRYNAIGEKPVLSIVEPKATAKLGGTFTIFGTAKVDIGTPSDVGEGYIQFSKSATFDATNCNINDVDFWKSGNGVTLTSISNGSWNYIANADSKLDPKGADKSWNLYVRVRGKNTRKNRLGDWTDPIQITVDKDTPTINSAKVQKGADPAQNYTSNMWVSDGCVLKADLWDASGLKEIKVMFGYYKNKEEVNGNGNNEFIFKKGESTPTWLLENGTVATGGKNYKLQLPMDLTKLVPDAQTNQTFKVNVFIQEDTNQNLNNSMEFTFRYDKLPPNGAFGEKIESGNANFGATSVTDPRLAKAVGDITGMSTKLILVDNVIVTPTSRTGDTVIFNETITGGTYNYIVYEPKAIIQGSFQAHGVANDDGSGVKSVKVQVKDRKGGTSTEVESTSSGANRFTREYGNQVVWNANINVSGLADGQGKVICTITDDAGNTKTSDTPVFISNKPITPTQLTFGTDLDANARVDEIEKLQMSITRDGTVGKQEKFYRGSVDFGTWTFKNVKSNFAVEFIGGNADLKYTLSVDNTGTLTALPNHENKTISSNGEISLNDADFTAIGDGTGKKLVLTLTDDSGWKATVNITVNVQIADTDAPKSAILPFYWNSKTDNSVVHMDVNRNTGINLGHIEFDGYDTGSGTYTNKPAISGTVIVKGTAYDEKLLNSLTFNFAGLTATVNYPNDSSSPWTVASGASAGLTVKAESKRLDQSGHYIVWEVMFESEKIANVVNADTTLSVVANDKGDNENSSQTSASSIISGIGTRKTNIKLQLQTGTDFSQIKPGMRVRMYNPNQKRQAYYASIASVDPDAKTIDVDSAVDDAEVKAYDIYKNDHNSYTMNVSIVPYISQVITPTSEEGDANNLTRYGRTAKGDYTVLKDANNQTEKIKVIGFNLTGAKYGGTAINTTVDVVRNITVARQSDSYAQNFITGGTYTQKALQFVPTNGDLELTVGSLKTINNSNKTDGDGFSGDVALWNNEGDNYAHKNVGDNRTIVVLSANELVKRTMITAPSFAVLNNKLGYAYSRITEFFMAQQTDNNVTRFGQNPGSYLGTAFAYDQWGNTFGISGNNDVTMGNNGAITQVSSYYLHWNVPGSVAAGAFGAGGYYYRTQANRIMALTPVTNINLPDALTQMRRARMQQPVLQTHGEYVYLAYYDMATQKLELRVDKPKRNGGLVAVNGLGSAGFKTFAGSLAERDKNNSYGATGGQTAGAMVFATTAGGGLATGLTITDAYVVVAYKTANGLELAYAPIADVEVPSADQSVDKFTKITVDADSSTGAYVRATSSGNVVHLAYYDSTSGGRLKYAKIDLGSTDKTPQVAVVDNVEGNTGYYTSITVNAAGKPFIAYAMKDYVDSASKIALKLAYPIEIGDVKNGSDETEQCYTGDWEIMNLRASYGLQGSNYDCPPQITAFYYNNDICVGYATMENLEYVKVPVNH